MNAELLRTIVGFTNPVSQSMYAKVGFGLTFLKYAVECLGLFAVTGKVYQLWHFLLPSVSLRSQFFETTPWAGWAIAIWTLPFIWIAVSMSVRRCADAEINPWAGLWVLVPVINLIVMLWLASVPSAPESAPVKRLDSEPAKKANQPSGTGINIVVADAEGSDSDNQTPVSWLVASAFFGILGGGVFAVMLTVISVYAVESYGAALFFGMPMVSGAIGAYIYNQPGVRDVWGSIGVGLLSSLSGMLMLLMFAMEGVICLVMAMPLVLPIGAMGGLIGWVIAKGIMVQSKYMIGGIALMLPVIGFLEHRLTAVPTFVCESEVVIQASPDEVWNNVIAFPDIESPPAWYFNLGLSCPLRARIEGQGVGAVRHCEFTTGDFVEPITVWNPPQHLAFDVTEQPDPMTELTPFRHVHPPHLEGSFKSVRGEFRLIDLGDGTTRLEGRTWYELKMGPTVYWRKWTDEIIHRIHLRVLNHIKSTTEGSRGEETRALNADNEWQVLTN